MKNTPALLFLFFFSLTSSAQTYIPMPDSAAIWINEYEEYIMDDDFLPVTDWVFYTCFTATGKDTLISLENYTQIEKCSGEYKGAMRSDSSQVFYIPGGTSTEYLLYDFSVNPGDTVFNFYTENIYEEPSVAEYFVVPGSLATEDSVLVNGTWRRRIEVLGWVEGVGNTQGLFWEWGENISNYFLYLRCHSIENTIVYPGFYEGAPCTPIYADLSESKQRDLKLFPNPTKSNLTIRPNGQELIQSIQIIDLQGRVVYNQFVDSQMEYQLNVESLNPSQYILVVTFTDKTIRSSFIKE